MTAQSGLGFSGIVAIQIPDDGATGEVLTKLTPDNYDYDWAAGGGGGAPTNAEYVVLTADATLTDERVLTAGTGISIVDGGAGGPVTISIAAGVVDLQFAYDADTTVPQITVNGTPDPVTIDASVAGSIFAVRNVANIDILRALTTGIDFFSAGNRLFSLEPDPTAKSGFEYFPDGRTLTTVPTNINAAIQWDSLVVTDIPGGAPFGNDSAVAMIQSIGECRFDDTGNLFSSSLLFNQATIVTCNGVNVGPIYTMVNQPTVRTGSLGGSRTVSQSNAVRSQMRVGPNVAGNIVLTSHQAYFWTMSVDATVGTASCTTAEALVINAPTLTAGGTIGTLNGIHILNIPAAGITTLRGIFSEMGSGTFILHSGSAPVNFTNAAFRMGFVDNAGIELGTGDDVLINVTAANQLEFAFAAFADDLRISNPANTRFLFQGNAGTGNGGDQFNFACSRFSLGAQTGAVGNQVGVFVTGARTIGVAGDWADFLLTQGGNITVNALAMGRVSAWVINPISYAASTGSVANADTLTVGGFPTSSPGVTITARQSLFVIGGRSRHASIKQYDPITPAVLAAGNNNDYAGFLTNSANNGMRHWARVQGDGGGTSVITGISATSAQNGDCMKLTNVSANNVTLGHQDANSAAANRIISPTGANYVLGADESAEVIYDATTARWRILYGSGA